MQKVRRKSKTGVLLACANGVRGVWVQPSRDSNDPVQINAHSACDVLRGGKSAPVTAIAVSL